MNNALYSEDNTTYGPYTLPEASVYGYTTRPMTEAEKNNMVIGGAGSLEYISTPLLQNAKRFMIYKNLHPQTSKSIRRRFLRRAYDSKYNDFLRYVSKLLSKSTKKGNNPLSAVTEDINYNIPNINFDISNVPYNNLNIGPKY